MDTLTKLAPAEECTGCGACIERCPKKAISYRDDKEGFPTPVIDTEKCVECGLCTKVCPVFHPVKENAIRAAYAAQFKDDRALKESSSGGLFTAFARVILSRGGVVFGCVYDEHYNALIREAKTEEELAPMRGSKYVWSRSSDAFPRVKEYLEEGREVMFTGLPCHTAGLLNYLGKDYPNLVTVVFFCGGAVSPLAYREYLKTVTKKVPLKDLDLKFRDKEEYGAGVHITYETGKGRVFEKYYQNSYFFGYHTKVYVRPCCYHCHYRYEGRISDLTFGDYWGVKYFHEKDFDDLKAGVSALLVDTEKGEALLEAAKDQLRIVPTRVEDIAAGNNLTLGGQTKIIPVPAYRDQFFETLKKRGWKAADWKYLHNLARVKCAVPVKYKRKIKKLLRR